MGPLLDRIDLRVEVPALGPEELTRVAGGACASEPHEPARVQQLRAVRAQRIERSGKSCAALSRVELQRLWPPDGGWAAATKLSVPALSARAIQRVLAVSRTIADLAGSEGIEREHRAEAIQLRRSLAGTAERFERERADQCPTSESM